MELASTAIGVVGLAALFSTCTETLDTLAAAARYSVNREILQTKIEVERLRLMVWGESAGLTDIDPSRPEDETGYDPDFLNESLGGAALRPAVAGLLACFAHYFEDIEQLQSRYGLVTQKQNQDKESTPALAEAPTRQILLTTFQRTYARFQQRTSKVQASTSAFKKAKWAITDERKFRNLVAELKAINDSLDSLLPAIRDKTRVQMRTAIMRSTDVDQLQNLVTAADEATDLIAETASLRLEMLSISGKGAVKPAPKVVQVTSASKELRGEGLNNASTQSGPSGSKSVVQDLIAATIADAPSPASVSTAPTGDIYDDTGALVVHKAYHKADSLACFSWHVGLGETTDLAECPPVADAMFGVAESFLEVDVVSDRKYAGWSPGSVSLIGFAREATFWKRAGELEKKPNPPSWYRVNSKPLSQDFLDKRWRQLVKEGLGDDFTDKKGYEQVLELLGPSHYTWLDPKEGYKLRHQITDLLGALSSSIIPNFEERGSIGLVAFHDQTVPNSPFGFIDFMRQMVIARELTLRIQLANQRWYGGITRRVIYDMIAADLWTRHVEIKPVAAAFGIPKAVFQRQVHGIIRFVDEMRWPYADEIQKEANHLLEKNPEEIALDLRLQDWLMGLVLPGARLPLILVGVLYQLSPTLRPHIPTESVKFRDGNFGIVYPEASYWNVRSVLGKVLAPLSRDQETNHRKVHCLGGWVGPCLSPSLPECRLGLTVSLSTRQPPFAPLELDSSIGDATKTTLSSIGGQGHGGEWMLPTPPELSRDTVALQTVRLSKAPKADLSAKDALYYTARIDFRLGRSRTFVTFTLYTNSVFVSVPPCRGTHKVDPHAAGRYTFAVKGIEEIARISKTCDAATDMAIMVVNATGGPASEVFARAWCCQTGTNAVIWRREGGKCCFKCALMVASTDGLGTGTLIAC
ncbi:uncharacterized protein N7496_008976 [Penicillium cataractarum]|uniref:Prion-inhibition and propagation HeLo domain-containing protein n=1 Tax=Penicillium cataractarum TaxID=2100454 RepID=A0A9W9RZN6_9EURO|nr:uncharacterized protein N7496_008976 [Penicillium cataractarum]KAJ5369216.1 hypothetical protein N7496_008976 [Penicillium cataractarum]